MAVKIAIVILNEWVYRCLFKFAIGSQREAIFGRQTERGESCPFFLRALANG